MYGKHFASMYEGSMIGAGAVVFAVWGYIISHMKPDKEVGFQVELNPKLLSSVIGESVMGVNKALEYLCAPDPESRNKDQDGKRLVRVGQYSYQVVSGARYAQLKDEEGRRAYNRARIATWRAKPDVKKKKASKGSGQMTGAGAYQRAEEAGVSQADLDRLSDSMLPERLQQAKDDSKDSECPL